MTSMLSHGWEEWATRQGVPHADRNVPLPFPRGSCKFRTKERGSQDPEACARWRLFEPFWIPIAVAIAGRKLMQMWRISWAYWAVLWR